MSSIDPTRILRLVKTLESGTTEEKIEMLGELDALEPLSSGVFMRALDDEDDRVRLFALTRLDAVAVRPHEFVMEQLLRDDNDSVRFLAEKLQAREDTRNPLDDLIPSVEKAAGALGPMGDVIRNMVGLLRDSGTSDERTMLRSLSRLNDDDPTAMVAIQQGLNSTHLSVRLAALRKVVELPKATVPEEMIASFIADPSPDVRAAADAVVKAGKVGSFDPDAFRLDMMKNMLGGLMKEGGPAAAGGLDFGEMLGGLMKEGGPAAAGGLDFGEMLKGAGIDMDSLDMDSLDMGSILGQGTSAEPVEGEGLSLVGEVDEASEHTPEGGTYIVADGRALKRVLNALSRVADVDAPPAHERLKRSLEPPLWVIASLPFSVDPPGWVETLEEIGLEITGSQLEAAEQARRVSEQVWGAAYADHTLSTQLTLVFHDGILSRAEWAGESPGGYSIGERAIAATEDGPTALLSAFQDDPTDDGLVI